MNKEDTHPMIDMLTLYHKSFEDLKRSNEEMGNLEFQKQYGLSLTPPSGWPFVKAIKSLVQVSMPGNVVIIYSSASMYRTIYDTIGNGKISYCSWHEIYVAMHTATIDQRAMKHFKDMIGSADLTIMVGAPFTFPDLIDQVRVYCESCLIILG